MTETENINEAIKQHPDEWLLFEVIREDAVNRPVQGLLLYHGKSRDQLHAVAMTKRSRDKRYYITFSGDPIPPDIAVVL